MGTAIAATLFLSSGNIASAQTVSFGYPDAGDRGIAADTIEALGLPQMPGNIRLLFQAKNVKTGDVISFDLVDNTGISKSVGSIQAMEDYNNFGGPWKNNGKDGFFMLLINDNDWNDPLPSQAAYTQTDRNIKLVIKRNAFSANSGPMSIRWLLAQPERIGMQAGALAVSPRQTHWGGIYWFGNISTSTLDTQPGSPIWALNQNWIDGLSLSLSWSRIQPNGPITPQQYKTSSMGQYVARILAQAGAADKKVNLYIRGTNSIALSSGATTCDDKNNLDGSQTNFGPVWAYDDWEAKGHSFRMIIDRNSLPKPDSCWLEVYDDTTINDLSELIVHNSANNALYDVVMGVYGDKTDPLNSVIGFISRPVAAPGPDPGQYGWYGLDPTEFKTYLSSHNMTRAQWMSWALSAFPQYGAGVVAGIKNNSGYVINSNSFLNHNWFKTSWGDQYDGKSDWYDYFYNAVMLDNKPFPRDPGLIFANYSLDGSTSDTKGIEYALTGNQYDETIPIPPVRNWWNLRAAGQDGGMNWTQASNSFFDSSSLDDSQFLKIRQGFYNAFNIGSRSFELWNSYILDINKTVKTVKNETRFIDEIDWFTQVFTLRNKLAYAADIANLPGAMIRNNAPSGSDTQLPSIAITSPTTGSNVSGITVITGVATDNVVVSSVAVFIDGAAYGLASGTASWTFSFNTAALTNSSHIITARAVDISGNAALAAVTVVVNNPGISAPVITSALTSTGTIGTALSYQITAVNSPVSFSAAGLPAGLSVNTVTGLISGTPATIGTSSVAISAANSSGTGSASLALSVYSACDLNQDGSTNVVDVQLQVNQALGATACTSDLNRDGLCNVIDVQRGVNAGLGGPCVVGP